MPTPPESSRPPVPVSEMLRRQESPRRVATEALDAATELGIPDALFIGLCEWIEPRPVDTTDNVGYRYDPNTRARALAACRVLVGLSQHGVIERDQLAETRHVSAGQS